MKVRNLQIVIDVKHNTVILPIIGRPVSCHINTIKNVSTHDEKGFGFLRINFLSPAGAIEKDDQSFEDASAHFVRSLTFRSLDSDRYRDSNRVTVLDDVSIRPVIEGKKIPGKAEIHQNGIRYRSPVDFRRRVDVLFANIRHVFFQSCRHEQLVMIHIHLKNPIIVGNKKTNDVQFYREATNIHYDDTDRKRKYRYGDEDEFESEQEERRRRVELDRLFQGFAQKIADEVDIPIRDLGFDGK
ncbi:FACT complex protein, partial [Tolypocladium capitatum]